LSDRSRLLHGISHSCEKPANQTLRSFVDPCPNFLAFPSGLQADTISGTVKDPSGAVVANARIEITGNHISQPIMLLSDELGKFSVPNLTAGKYSVRVAKEGFEELITPVDLHDIMNLDLKLTIATQQTRVNVTEKSAGLANSDPAYRQLRDDGLGQYLPLRKL